MGHLHDVMYYLSKYHLKNNNNFPRLKIIFLESLLINNKQSISDLIDNGIT